MSPSPSPWVLRTVLASLGACALALGSGCGGGGGAGGGGGTELPKVAACLGGGDPPITVSGNVRYERHEIGPPPTGLGALVERPARYVDVDVRVAGGGACHGRGSTDALGNYSVTVLPPTGGALLEVVAFSRTKEDPDHEIFVHQADPPGGNAHSEIDVYAYGSPPFPSSASVVVDLVVPYSSGPPSRPSIGFALLDTAATCWDGVIAPLGPVLGANHLYCTVGNNATLGGTSYFSPVANAIAILGGAAGSPDTSDTDYFDDAVVAHEVCHYVDAQISHSMTRGGVHGGEPIEPAFAWSEGMATGLGCLLLGSPWYVDSTGTSGGLLFPVSVENAPASFDPPGIGGEFTVAEILWDLGDGGGGPASTDGDGAAVPLAEIVGAIATFQAATDGPYVGLFLDRLVAAPGASITSGGVSALLAGPPENQGIGYPLAGPDVWPIAIAVGGASSGTLDSLPGGGKNACQGITSSAWHQLVLPTARTVSIHLAITPVAGGGNDLDLYLHANQDVNKDLAKSVSGGSASESISISLAAGTYVIRVVAPCGGAGNRASFDLTVN